MKNFDEKQALEQAKELQRYEGKVVALVDNKVATSGESVEHKFRQKFAFAKYTFSV